MLFSSEQGGESLAVIYLSQFMIRGIGRPAVGKLAVSCWSES
jgi:hypothetical protein